jgi:hypothetical protein
MDDAGPISRPVVCDCLGATEDRPRQRGRETVEPDISVVDRAAVVQKLRDAFKLNKAAYGEIPEERFQDCLGCKFLYAAGCKHIEANSCSERWVKWRIKVAEGACAQHELLLTTP